MGITLDEILLDANTSNIAISDGTNTASVDANGGLNVNILDGVNVEVDLSHLDDSVRLGDGTNFFTSTLENGDIALDVHISNSDLDIRNLDATTDNVAISDGTHTLDIQADGSLNVNLSSTVADDEVFSENGLPMAGRGVSGALTALSASGDKYNLIGDLYRRTWINSSRNISMLNSAATVGATAAQVLASPLAGRREVTIQNRSNNSVFIGSTAGVTTSNGVEIPKGGSATYELGEDIDIYMIAGSAGNDVRFLEMA